MKRMAHQPMPASIARSTGSRRSSARSATRSSRRRSCSARSTATSPRTSARSATPRSQKKYNIEMCPKGHGLPEALLRRVREGTRRPRSHLPDDGWCAPHGKPEALCPDCAEARDRRSRSRPERHGQGLPRSPCPMVRLASAKLARQIGIQTAEVDRGGARPPARGERRDRLRRQPLRRDQPARRRASSARSGSTSARPSGGRGARRRRLGRGQRGQDPVPLGPGRRPSSPRRPPTGPSRSPGRGPSPARPSSRS